MAVIKKKKKKSTVIEYWDSLGIWPELSHQGTEVDIRRPLLLV